MPPRVVLCVPRGTGHSVEIDDSATLLAKARAILHAESPAVIVQASFLEILGQRCVVVRSRRLR